MGEEKGEGDPRSTLPSPLPSREGSEIGGHPGSRKRWEALKGRGVRCRILKGGE
jgi:hypothetical protein